MNLNIIKLTGREVNLFGELINLFNATFQNDKSDIPADHYLQRLLAKENFHVFVALDPVTVVGGITVYSLDQYYSSKPIAYIYDLAVKPELQRKGIGSKLVEYVKTYFANQGYDEVYVQAETADEYAVEFYRKTRPKAEIAVVQFSYELPPVTNTQ